MRLLAAAMVMVLAAAGCASVVGLEFDRYGEGAVAADGGGAFACVPRSTARCLCELADGVQTCSDDGHLSACECRDASAPPPGPRCGNGIVEPGEACDDGNTTSGDGCSSLCMPDGRPQAVEDCPGQPITVWRGRIVRIDLTSFVRGGGDVAGTCGAQPERVYAITAVAGELAIAVSSDTPLNFSVRTTCAAADATVICAAVVGGAASRKIAVQPGQTYFLRLEPLEPAARSVASIVLEGS